MRWLWRYTIYFVKPVLIWYIAGYFSYLSLKAVASAFLNYDKGYRKGEISARQEIKDTKDLKK